MISQLIVLNLYVYVLMLDFYFNNMYIYVTYVIILFECITLGEEW